MTLILRVGIVSALLMAQPHATLTSGTHQAPTSGMHQALTSGPVVLQIRHLQTGAESRTTGSEMSTGIQVIAKDVEIHIGSATIIADEAEIRRGRPGEPSDVELRGNVRLKAPIEIAYRDQR